MQQLIRYISDKYIHRDINRLFTHTNLLEAVSLWKQTKINSQHYTLLQFLIAKGFVQYSPSNFNIKLNLSSFFFYQRAFKLKRFGQKYLGQNFSLFFDNFVSNDLLPTEEKKKQIEELIIGKQKTKNKNKKKQQQQNNKKIDLNRLIHIIRDQNLKQQLIQYVIDIAQLTQLVRLQRIQNYLGTRKNEILKQIVKQEIDNQNLFFKIYQKNKDPKIIQIIDKIKYQIKWEIIEDFLLQIFSKHEDAATQNFNNNIRNTLMIFNLLKKHPLVSQKQLCGFSMLSTVQVKKCLNILLSEGLLLFYCQNTKSTLYRIQKQQKIQQKFINELCKSIFRIHDLIEHTSDKQQLFKLQIMLRSLDDTLLLVGY